MSVAKEPKRETGTAEAHGNESQPISLYIEGGFLDISLFSSFFFAYKIRAYKAFSQEKQ